MIKTIQNRISMRSIASEAGLSVTTVHHILNNKGSKFISDGTRQRVLQLAQDMGYRKNIGYQLMRGEKTRTVAVVSSTMRLHRQPFGDLVISLAEKLEAMNYAVYIGTLGYDPDENLRKIQELLSRGVEHFIMVGNPLGYQEIQQEILRAGCTIVGHGLVFDRYVDCDIINSQREIIEFFLASNHRNIRVICQISHAPNRFGPLKLLRQCFPGLSDDELLEKYVYTCPDPDTSRNNVAEIDFQRGQEATKKLLAEHPETDAILYDNDNIALGGAKILFERGIRVGKDILLAGRFNIPAVQQYCLPVSSTDINIGEISRALLENAFSNAPCREIIQATTVIRKI